MENKNLVFIIIGILIVIFLLKSTSLGMFSIFPDQTANSEITPSKTSYIEGDTLNIIGISPTGVGACGFLGKAIWIDGKKYGCSGEVLSGACGYPTGNSPPRYNFCTRQTCVSDGGIKITNGPPWGFDYGSVEIPLELTPGTHTVEGWATSGVYQVGCCGFPPLCSSGYFRFTINVAPKPCVLQPNQLLAMQGFIIGDEVSSNTLIYPAAQWCSQFPVIVTDQYSKIARNDYSLFTRLKNGEKLIVPSNEAWAVFYVINNPGDLPVVCSHEMAYSSEEKKCVDITGIVTICRGQIDDQGRCVTQAFEEISEFICCLDYDEITDTCLVKAGNYYSAEGICKLIIKDIRPICEEGFTLSEDKTYCYYLITEIQPDCIEGNLSSDGTKCILSIEPTECPTETTLSPDGKFCIYEPSTEYSCPEKSNLTWDSTTQKNICVTEPEIKTITEENVITKEVTKEVFFEKGYWWVYAILIVFVILAFFGGKKYGR